MPNQQYGRIILASPDLGERRIDPAYALAFGACLLGVVGLLILPLLVESYNYDTDYFRQVGFGFVVMLAGMIIAFVAITRRRNFQQFVLYEQGFQYFRPVKLRDGSRTRFIPYSDIKEVKMQIQMMPLSEKDVKRIVEHNEFPSFTIIIRLKDGVRLTASWQTFARPDMGNQETLDRISKAYRTFLALKDLIEGNRGRVVDKSGMLTLSVPPET